MNTERKFEGINPVKKLYYRIEDLFLDKEGKPYMEDDDQPLYDDQTYFTFRGTEGLLIASYKPGKNGEPPVATLEHFQRDERGSFNYQQTFDIKIFTSRKSGNGKEYRMSTTNPRDLLGNWRTQQNVLASTFLSLLDRSTLI